MTMRRSWSMRSLAILLLLVALAAWGEMQETTAFRVSKAAEFGPLKPALQALAREAKHRTNHFCVVGYRLKDGEKQAWVHWKEGKQLILWEARSPESENVAALVQSRRRIRLEKDVVATEAEVAGSTYLVTRSWVTEILQDCRAHGDQVTISNRPSHPGAPSRGN